MVDPSRVAGGEHDVFVSGNDAAAKASGSVDARRRPRYESGMSASLEDVTTPSRIGDGRFTCAVPDGWQQGRGAFGGLVLGSLARAIEVVAAAPERKLRTLTGELCGPVQPGSAEIVVEPLRVGSGTSTLAARLVQGGEVQAHAVAVLGRDRARDADHVGIERPAMPPWRELPPISDGVLPPPFARFFEYRLAAGAPMSAGAVGHTAGWIRARDPGAARGGPFLVAMADCWWPALFSRLSVGRPMATITFTLDVTGTCDGLDPSAPLFHDARVLATADGYSTELRTLWGEDGRLLAINHQTFVVIR